MKKYKLSIWRIKPTHKRPIFGASVTDTDLSVLQAIIENHEIRHPKKTLYYVIERV